jgi:hypothetical protein
MADEEQKLAPLSVMEPETCVSAYAAAIVRTYARVRAVEAANDGFVALARFDREAPTVVERDEGGA